MDALSVAQFEFPDDYENPRKIPRVTFIQDVEKYLKELAVPLEDVFKRLQEDFQKCKLIEAKLQQGHASFLTKVPEIERNLQVIEFLEKQREEMEGESKVVPTTFSIAETLYVDGEIPIEKAQPLKIGLWLGANVMAEYTLDEAKELLNRNLTRLRRNIESTGEDLAFIREQIIVLEVNMARVYNYDVSKNRSKSS